MTSYIASLSERGDFCFNRFMRIFDAHTHVHFMAFDADRDEVIKRALNAGIGMVNVGTDKKTSADAVALAERYDGLYATVGLHPIHTSPSFRDEDEGDETPETEFDFDWYFNLAKHPKVVAIGECGFDYFYLPKGEGAPAQGGSASGGKEKQKQAFLAQIRLAKEVGKPLMLHCRSSADGKQNAYRDLIDTLKTNNLQLTTPPGISHFFSGTLDEAKELLDLGFYFTFGGAITLPKKSGGADFEALVRIVPLDRILCETDAPYVAPLRYRGKRNEPFYVDEVVKKLADLRGVSIGEMERITLENMRRIFNSI